MFGSISNYENKFFLREEQIPGIESIDISYSNSPTTTRALGINGGITTIGAVTQQKISITRNLINDDPFLLYLDSDSIRGGIEYNGKSYMFNSGYLDEYMISCAVGSIPKVTTNITVYDEMQTGQLFQPWSYVREKIIPNQGSISVTCDNSTTNRVIGFDYAIKRTRKPMYTIGSQFPSEIVTFPTLEYAASVQIDVDDAFLQSGFSFLNNRENKSIIFTIKGNNGSDIQSLTIPNASLIAESLSSSADGGVKLTLNYIGHVGDENPVINLEFAKDQTIVPRIGPQPTFIRDSVATYFGPSEIEVNYNYLGSEYNFTCTQNDQIVNGRYQWSDNSSVFTYADGFWELFHDGNLVATSAPTTEWRPDRADWSGANIIVNISDTFEIVNAAPNEPRFEHDPITLECLGLLKESQSINRILQSDAPATQTIATNKTLHTLSFYGTGTITLSGTHTATVVGISDKIRQVYTFIPSLGSLILTISGSVKFAQLERLSSASSYIRTSNLEVTRSSDNLFYGSANFFSFYNNLAGTFIAESIVNGLTLPIGGQVDIGGLAIAVGTEQDGILIFTKNAPESSLQCIINIDERDIVFRDSLFNDINAGVSRKFAFAFKAGKDFEGNDGNAIICFNGALGIENNALRVPGQFGNGSFPSEMDLFLNQFSIIRSFSYYRNRLSNEKLKKLTLI